jgi:hypothetical protein
MKRTPSQRIYKRLRSSRSLDLFVGAAADADMDADVDADV